MTETKLKSQFQMIEDKLNAAYEKNDLEEISRLLSDDWTILEPSTGLSGKEQFIKAIKDRNLIHSSMKKEVLQVKLYDDFAIVITRGKNEGRYFDKPFNAEQWVTNIYKKNNSQWICVMTQESPVAC
jgi:ketosteroid isomerase-like protein